MTTEYVEMGACSKPHGIKGELIFNLINREDSSIRKGIKILLKPKSVESSLSDKGEEFIVESIRFGNKTIVRLKDVADRNKVESLIPFSIWIDRKDFAELDSDEVFLADLINLYVFDSEDNKIGIIENYYDNGAQPVLVILLDDKSGDQDRVELPFVPAFFPDVNLEEKKIIMINPGIY
jgi:16S rRNA processing protein RimM